VLALQPLPPLLLVRGPDFFTSAIHCSNVLPVRSFNFAMDDSSIAEARMQAIGRLAGRRAADRPPPVFFGAVPQPSAAMTAPHRSTS